MGKIVLTGIKCTGTPHVGNYLGAIRPMIDMGGTHCFIADYHALNQVHEPKAHAESVKQVACTWLACGLDPKKTVFYRQSDVPEVFELATILTNVTPKGLMNRAHSYKAAIASNIEQKRDADFDVNMGLYNYPILMAADILLFNTNLVPVGSDQKQHIEIACDIAKSFNAVYGDTLVVPKETIREDVATIQGLDGRKMSKSYGNIIPLFCDSAELLKCVKRIATDSSAPNEAKPKEHLIFQLYKHFTGKELDNKIGWGDAKQKLFEAMDKVIAPMREKYNHLMSHYAEVEKILEKGSVEARGVARETLDRVRKAIGVK
ncbi:MAG: tryptophan--tRNA ligase [Christensenellaceae bacterium]|jgi:tryptophanyl-tRNA synthetase|nr:tryptophan--tRNA ligase [Christensenellaceae bacterium]